jgi:membrane fusion protein, macrolide-specific efflux system
MSSTERAALLDAARNRGAEELAYWKEVYKTTPLVAPISGEVIVRAVEPGQTVTTGDAVLVLSDRLIVKAYVDEVDIGGVRAGQTAMIGLDAYPEVKVRGRVNHISYESKIQNNVTIYEVDLVPDQIPDVFRSGMSANVQIIKARKENVLLIPRSLAQEDTRGVFVTVRDPRGQVTRREVKLGLADEKNAEVTEGLSTEDRVVLVKVTAAAPETTAPSGNPLLPKFGPGRRAGGH